MNSFKKSVDEVDPGLSEEQDTQRRIPLRSQQLKIAKETYFLKINLLIERQSALRHMLAKEDEALNEEMGELGFYYLPPDD